MRALQKQIIAELGVSPQIDPAAEVERRVAFLADYLEATGASGLVLGISGGVDSTTGGRLAQLAVERRREQLGASGDDPVPSRTNPRFTAVRLPYRVQRDEAEAQAAMDFVAADREVTFNVAGAVDAFAEEYAQAAGEPLRDFDKGNVKARLRMTAQYALAGAHGQLVVGTDQASEAVTGFYTKFGDGGADVLPLAGLDKRQVRAVARHLGAPEALWAKVPTADLLEGQPGRADEDELGMTYEHIDDYLEGRDIPESVAERLEAVYLRSRHKRTTPVGPADTWWR